MKPWAGIVRRLEIGPGKRRIKGFETVNAVRTSATDHVADARALPFPDCTFGVVYASHVIEHLPWYETGAVLAEWVRVLKPGGALEVWTVDAFKVAQAIVACETTGAFPEHDGWSRHGAGENPYLWFAGRIFAYAKGGGGDSLNWHRALFTPRHLAQCLERAGLGEVRPMDRSHVRGHDHGWVNLGMRGVRP
jgi:SAM-dependent methyltransferase